METIGLVGEEHVNPNTTMIDVDSTQSKPPPPMIQHIQKKRQREIYAQKERVLLLIKTKILQCT